MADAIFRINYKSDFVLTMQSDAGWAIPFCIKFWTGSPSRAYYAQWDGETYTNCALDEDDETQLTVQFDDHNMGIGNLQYQIAYHLTADDFPTTVEDEVTNQDTVIIDDDGTELQVMLDLNGETAPELIFSLPAYAAESERVANEEARVANEEARVAAEAQRASTFTAQMTAINEAIEEAETAADNAKADYVGDDSYVYHWDSENQEYVRTDLYVKGEDGVSAYESAVAGGYEGTEEEFNVYLSNNAQFGRILLGMDDIPTFEELNASGSDIAIGTYCTYNENLYVFTSVHTAGAEWDSDEVYGPTNLFNEVQRMMSADYEEVTIILQTEDGGGDVEGVNVEVTVEGESEARTLYTDANGICTTNVQRGLTYVVACNNIDGYEPVNPVTKRASLPVRTIEFNYLVDETLTQEHVKVTLSYADSSLGTASEIYVSTDGGSTDVTYAVTDNVAEFDVDFGTQYIISFEAVDGYSTPRTRTYIAEHHGTRPISVRYNVGIDGIMWLMADGSEREIGDVTDDDRANGEIFGLIVQTSDLLEGGGSFVIPMSILLRSSAITTGTWLNAQEEITTMNFFTSHASALLDIDGRSNCDKILEYISEKAAQGVTRTSTIAQYTYNNMYGGYDAFSEDYTYSAGRYVRYNGQVYQFSTAHAAGAWDATEVTLIYDIFDADTEYAVGAKVMYNNVLYEFISAHAAGDAWSSSEVERAGYLMPDSGAYTMHTEHCFTPAYGQIYRYRENRAEINEVTNDIFGTNCINVASGNWWSSTQYNATSGVYLLNGSFSSFSKTNYYTISVLPVLAY